MILSGDLAGVHKVQHIFFVLLLLLAHRLVLCYLIHRMVPKTVLRQLVLDISEISSPWDVYLIDHLGTVASTAVHMGRIDH